MTSAADFDKKYDIIDAPTPPSTLMSGQYKQSFAYHTMRDRLPVTLTSIIDTLTKNKEQLVVDYGEEAREEIKAVVGLLSKLKYELQTDKPLQPFTGNEPDIEVWNKFIAELPKTKNSFFKACWLYSECYMYRRVSSFFENTSSLIKHDYFADQKMNAMIISTEAMAAVAHALKRTEKSEEMFRKLLKLNLWGNRCDLSITSGKEVKPDANAFEIIDELDKNLLIDDTAAIWTCLNTADHSKPVVVDIICDNAGFEIFTDFILADYMLDKNLASKVRFHVKAIPWFISDVTSTDFHWSILRLVQHNNTVLRDLGKRWSQYVLGGKFELQPTEYFWTSPYEFYRMRDVTADLYSRLGESHLAIFKGDLNYRKLLGDYTWQATDEFLVCLRGFQPTSLCTLRTVKADLICGLRPGQIEQLYQINDNWMTTGEYGIIQFAKSNRCDCVA